MNKRLIKQLIPPALWSVAARTKRAVFPKKESADKPQLFNGSDGMFRSALEGAKAYAEYGVGLSTAWVDQNTDATIRSVDTSEYWLDQTRQSLTRDQHKFVYVDVGPLQNWGYPIGFTKRDNFLAYAEAVWGDNYTPDLVLVDGRFRIACFLTSLIRARPGCKIIFDDYTDRPHYHVVEDYLAPTQVTHRQALFVVPEDRDIDTLTRVRDQFLFVRE